MPSVLSLIGAVTVTTISMRLILFLQPYLKPSKLDRYLTEKDSWALVTGATDGLGLAFVQELAHRGFNVVIHGRDPDKLNGIKTQLEKQYPGRRFQILVLDASTTTPQQITSLSLPPISVLINNVGGGPPGRLWLRFHDRTVQEVADMVTMNATFTAMLTHRVLGDLQKTQPPRLVINVGSVVSSLHAAWMEPYCGTKAFIESFSEALHVEMVAEGHDNNVEIMCLKAASISTKSSQLPPSFTAPTPRVMAKAGLDRVGSGRVTTGPLLRHEVMFAVMGMLPKATLSKVINSMNSFKIGRG
ncbi:Very-long-chain 3-oxoacyl-CoA 1 [Cyphellophora attinorum]|uniref:Very-long-chain 3-oxoacyl-CoA 1 n=1 Tax=Cyphellophora attinorum TaxID=1664694 RepID=A0A0N1HX93_9EURO|nr:Very-long-chain 3-oxoacyl-CoA 1 [Phialophora attinorum]KPI45100.1 Very-long-chain 3-oxoacyl-CoA 1 [Phialophora attinorum]